MSHTPRSVSEADQLGGSFETFYKATRPRIFRAVALVLGETDVALDATEEAMTRAAERWPVVGRYDNPAGWVYRVAGLGRICGVSPVSEGLSCSSPATSRGCLIPSSSTPC